MKKNILLIFLILLNFTGYINANAELKETKIKSGLEYEFLFRESDTDDEGYLMDSKKKVYYKNNSYKVKYSEYVKKFHNGIKYVKYFTLLNTDGGISFWTVPEEKNYENNDSYPMFQIMEKETSKLIGNIKTKDGVVYYYDGKKETKIGNINVGKWNHFYVSKNKIYINGNESLYSNGKSFRLVRNLSYVLSDIKIYRSVLSNSQIKEIYNESKDVFGKENIELINKNSEYPSNALISDFRFNGSTANSITSSNYNITHNLPYSFITMGNNNLLRGHFTIEGETNSDIKAISTVISSGDGGEIGYLYAPNNTIIYSIDYGNQKGIGGNKGTLFLENTFCDKIKGCHLLAIIRGGKLEFYINGSLINEKNINETNLKGVRVKFDATENLKFYNNNITDEDIDKLINLYKEPVIEEEIIILQELKEDNTYEVSATSKLGNINGYSIRSDNICDETVTFNDYTGKIIFDNVINNGKKVCFRSTYINSSNETVLNYKISSEIDGIVKNNNGPTDKTTEVNYSDLFHDYKKWDKSLTPAKYNEYYIILNSTVNQDSYYGVSPIFTKFVDINSDGKIDVLSIERNSYTKEKIINGIPHYETEIQKKYAVLVNNGNGKFIPEFRCVYDYFSNGRGESQSMYYGDCSN